MPFQHDSLLLKGENGLTFLVSFGGENDLGIWTSQFEIFEYKNGNFEKRIDIELNLKKDGHKMFVYNNEIYLFSGLDNIFVSERNEFYKLVSFSEEKHLKFASTGTDSLGSQLSIETPLPSSLNNSKKDLKQNSKKDLKKSKNSKNDSKKDLKNISKSNLKLKNESKNNLNVSSTSLTTHTSSSTSLLSDGSSNQKQNHTDTPVSVLGTFSKLKWEVAFPNLQSQESQSQTQIQSRPHGRRLFGLQIVDKCVYITGGKAALYKSSQVLNDSWVFNFEQKNWKKLEHAVLPEGLSGISLNYDDKRNRLILFGGINAESKYSNKVYELSLNSVQGWKEIQTTIDKESLVDHLIDEQNIPSGRERHSSVYSPSNDCLIVFGGWGMGGCRNDCWSLNLGNNTWKYLKINTTSTTTSGDEISSDLITESINAKRYGHQAFLFDGALWLHGGKSVDWKNIERMDRNSIIEGIKFTKDDNDCVSISNKTIDSLLKSSQIQLTLSEKIKNIQNEVAIKEAESNIIEQRLNKSNHQVLDIPQREFRVRAKRTRGKRASINLDSLNDEKLAIPTNKETLKEEFSEIVKESKPIPQKGVPLLPMGSNPMLQNDLMAEMAKRREKNA